MRNKTLLAAIFIILSLYACRHEVITTPVASTPSPAPAPVTNPGTNPAENAVCFEEGILPIFKSNCAKSGCHDAASGQDGYVLDSYSNIVKDGVKPGNASDSKIYKVLLETDLKKRMPQSPNPPLAQLQIELIKTWIDQGAKNTVNCNTGCDIAAFTYTATIKPIINTNCLGCHNGPAAGAGLDYTTHAGLKAATANGRLLGAITHAAGYSPMPKGVSKLSECKITQIKKWIDAGAPNN